MTDDPQEGMSEFDAEQVISDLRQALHRAHSQVRAARDRNAELVRVTHQAAYDAMMAQGPIPQVRPPNRDRRRKGTPEVAVWDMGDWQGSKRTVSYDTPTMQRRVLQFTEKAELLTSIHRADHPVRKAALIFGGDMVEGLFNFPTQAFEIDATLHEQYVVVSRLIVEVIRRALSIYEHVTVVPEWGNHGRIGSKRDAVPRSDNIDRMCFTLAREILTAAGEGNRLTFPDSPEDIQRLEIGNYRALVMHGDEVGRNGFASPATIVRHVTAWQSGAYPWEFRDCYVHHYHQHMEFPLPNGRGSVFFTGSTESDNRYARDQMASAALPSQRLHFIEPDKGFVTSQHKIVLAT